MTDNNRIEYIPPAPEVIDEYVRRVCDDKGITEREVRSGYASFLKLAARVVAKQLTIKHNQSE